jgi:segregation and condensation protein A
MSVHELELDLEAFEGPFDLLLTLVLKEEVPLADIDVAGVVLAFVEELAERDELDLEACGEFLVLVSSLLELKARVLLAGEDVDLEELDPEEAAEELARRLAEYRRFKEASLWLTGRLAEEGDRYFRLELVLPSQEPEQLVAALRMLAVEPPPVSLEHMALRFPPVSVFLERFRALLGRRRRFDFDQEVGGLTLAEQAVAFLALLELRKRNEISLSQAAPFAPIRVARAGEETSAADERRVTSKLRSA